jgi:hypothetical protein
MIPVAGLLNATLPGTRPTAAVYLAMKGIHLLPVKSLAVGLTLNAQITVPVATRIVSTLVCMRTHVQAMLTVWWPTTSLNADVPQALLATPLLLAYPYPSQSVSKIRTVHLNMVALAINVHCCVKH